MRHGLLESFSLIINSASNITVLRKMRQIIIGHSDSSKLGTYKVVIGEETLSAVSTIMIF